MQGNSRSHRIDLFLCEVEQKQAILRCRLDKDKVWYFELSYEFWPLIFWLFLVGLDERSDKGLSLVLEEMKHKSTANVVLCTHAEMFSQMKKAMPQILGPEFNDDLNVLLDWLELWHRRGDGLPETYSEIKKRDEINSKKEEHAGGEEEEESLAQAFDKIGLSDPPSFLKQEREF